MIKVKQDVPKTDITVDFMNRLYNSVAEWIYKILAVHSSAYTALGYSSRLWCSILAPAALGPLRLLSASSE